MHINCDTCTVRGSACSGCVVTMLLGGTPEGVDWDETERAAMGALADSGLVRPLLLSVAGGSAHIANAHTDDVNPAGFPRRRTG